MADGDKEKERVQDSSRISFKVTDRRLFTPEGDPRRDIPEEIEEPAREGSRSAPESGSREPGFQHRPVNEPEGIDFTVLVNAMTQPALIYLGEIAHPATGKPVVDLEQARVQIDMLDLVRVKTRGNLTAEEEGLLDRVLYQLRMLYVSRSGTATPQR